MNDTDMFGYQNAISKGGGYLHAACSLEICSQF